MQTGYNLKKNSEWKKHCFLKLQCGMDILHSHRNKPVIRNNVKNIRPKSIVIQMYAV